MTLLSLVNCETLNKFLVIFGTCRTWFMNNGLKSTSELIKDFLPLPTTSFSLPLYSCLLRKCVRISCDVISGSTIVIYISSLIINGYWWSNEYSMLVVPSMLRSLKWDVKLTYDGNEWQHDLVFHTIDKLVYWSLYRHLRPRLLPR